MQSTPPFNYVISAFVIVRNADLKIPKAPPETRVDPYPTLRIIESTSAKGGKTNLIINKSVAGKPSPIQ